MLGFPFFSFLTRIRQLLKRVMYGTVASTVAVVVYGTFSEYVLENPLSSSGIHSLFQSFWWVIETITTVGYGDIPIVSFWGKLNAVAIMLFGIGSLGVFTASIAANLVEYNFAAKLGEARIRMKDHVIVCNYDERLSDLVSELNENDMQVVILDDEDPKLSHGTYSYVRGKCTSNDDLSRAGIDSASKVVVLPDKEFSDRSSADAKSILTSMVIKKLKPEIYLIVELLKTENVEHATLGGADEVVVKGGMSLLLLASTVTSPGVSKLFFELLKGKDGYRIREYDVEEKYRNKKCDQFYKEMESGGRVVLGFRKGDEIKIRPAGDIELTWNSVVLMEPRQA